ncbi:MAG: N-acetyltransferase [Azospirillaceae bacterium]
MLDLSPERATDSVAVESLLDVAFGPDRHAKRSYAFREGIAPVADLCWLMRDGSRIVGAIRYWPVRAGGYPALLLGPLAVAPDRRGEGIGKALVDATLERAAAAGHGLVLLVGEPVYYARFGFEPAAPLGLVMPGEHPERLMVRLLDPAAVPTAPGPEGLVVERWRTAGEAGTAAYRAGDVA